MRLFHSSTMDYTSIMPQVVGIQKQVEPIRTADTLWAARVVQTVFRGATMTRDGEPWLVYEARMKDGIRAYTNHPEFEIHGHVSLGFNHGDEMLTPHEIADRAEELIRSCEVYRESGKVPNDNWEGAPVGPVQLGLAIRLAVNIFRSTRRKGDGTNDQANRDIYGINRREIHPLQEISRILGMPWDREGYITDPTKAVQYEKLYRVYAGFGDVDFYNSNSSNLSLDVKDGGNAKEQVDVDLNSGQPLLFLIRELLRREIARYQASAIGPADGSRVRTKYHFLRRAQVEELWFSTLMELEPNLVAADLAKDAWRNRARAEFNAIRKLVEKRVRKGKDEYEVRLFNHGSVFTGATAELSTINFPQFLQFFNGQEDEQLADMLINFGLQHRTRYNTETQPLSVEWKPISSLMDAMVWPSLDIPLRFANGTSGIRGEFIHTITAKHPRLVHREPRETAEKLMCEVELRTDKEGKVVAGRVYDAEKRPHFFTENDLSILMGIITDRLENVRTGIVSYAERTFKSPSAALRDAKVKGMRDEAMELLEIKAVMERGHSVWMPEFMDHMHLAYDRRGRLHQFKVYDTADQLGMTENVDGYHARYEPVKFGADGPILDSFDSRLITDYSHTSVYEYRIDRNVLASEFGNAAYYIDPERLDAKRLVFGIEDLDMVHAPMRISRPDYIRHMLFVNPWHAQRMLEGLFVLSKMPLRTEHGTYTSEVKSWIRQIVSRVPAYFAAMQYGTTPELDKVVSACAFAKDPTDMDDHLRRYSEKREILSKWLPAYLLADLLGEQTIENSRPFRQYAEFAKVARVSRRRVDLPERAAAVDTWLRDVIDRFVLNMGAVRDDSSETQLNPELNEETSSEGSSE